jgi:ribosomal protein L37E
MPSVQPLATPAGLDIANANSRAAALHPVFRPQFRVASRLPPVGTAMEPDDDDANGTKTCERCGGRAFYWDSAIVPGNPTARRGSRAAVAHAQPAWQCLSCGHIEPRERRASMAQRRAG